jgi:hypothetical protein
VSEKYWDHSPCLDQHPKFGEESEYAKGQMSLFSAALSSMAYPQALETLVLGQASEGITNTVETAAFSGLHPIYGGLDY